MTRIRTMIGSVDSATGRVAFTDIRTGWRNVCASVRKSWMMFVSMVPCLPRQCAVTPRAGDARGLLLGLDLDRRSGLAEHFEVRHQHRLDDAGDHEQRDRIPEADGQPDGRERVRE